MRIGVIGGSGLYEMDGVSDVRYETVETPFGSPSDSYAVATIEGREVVFLPRHGRGHRLLPAEINHRANIFGFKLLGVSCIFSVSAVGSLREERRPRDIVLPDQYFDRTKQSMAHTFFGDGLVAHVSLADPTCATLRAMLVDVAREAVREAGVDVQVHEGGTYVSMEGPAFSTRAESNAYRLLGGDVIGMTGVGEARLCREAEICYQPLAMVTDYDCWRESDEAVTVDMVVGHLKANTALARQIVKRAATAVDPQAPCACRDALKYALLTDPAVVPQATKRRLAPIVGRYLPAD